MRLESSSPIRVWCCSASAATVPAAIGARRLTERVKRRATSFTSTSNVSLFHRISSNRSSLAFPVYPLLFGFLHQCCSVPFRMNFWEFDRMSFSVLFFYVSFCIELLSTFQLFFSVLVKFHSPFSSFGPSVVLLDFGSLLVKLLILQFHFLLAPPHSIRMIFFFLASQSGTCGSAQSGLVHLTRMARVLNGVLLGLTEC